jgi:hypothetical protein
MAVSTTTPCAAPRRRPKCLALLTILAAAWLPACAAEPDSPEAQIRALLQQAEAAAEEKNVGALKQLLSESYSDDHGQDRQAVAGLLTFTFLRNQSVHLLTRVRSIEFPEPAQARTTVFVAMAGTPIPGIDELPRVRADLYRFDFSLGDEGSGDWRVTRAAWRRASADDFL